MKIFLFGFASGAVSISLVWKFLYARVKADLKQLRSVVVADIDAAKKRL